MQVPSYFRVVPARRAKKILAHHFTALLRIAVRQAESASEGEHRQYSRRQRFKTSPQIAKLRGPGKTTLRWLPGKLRIYHPAIRFINCSKRTSARKLLRFGSCSNSGWFWFPSATERLSHSKA